jgi:hypothetical protein
MKILIEESVLRQALEALEMTIAFQDANTPDGYAEHSVLYPSKVEADWHKVRRAITAHRTALDAAETAEPDGYIEIETYDDITDFGFAASFEQGVLDHIKDKVLRLIDEEITVPEMHVRPFYFHPSDDVKLREDAARYRWLREQTRPDDFYSNKVFWDVSFQQCGLGHIVRGDQLDAAIDAAMQEKQP